MKKLSYFSRIIDAYILKKTSQLTFWHGKPEINSNADYKSIGEFYQLFEYKAYFNGDFDDNGVILLDYHGNVGKQRYHIAISQYGLACYNQYKRTNNSKWFNRFMAQVNWHEKNLKKNNKGIYLFYADFDWDYHGIVKAPWASGLAQGNALSLFVRAYTETQDKKYLDICEKLFESMITEIKDGGVLNKDGNNYWIEEMLASPKHILNGFMWAIMGIYDYYLLTKNKKVKIWFDRFINTVKNNLNIFDTGYWSLYELSNSRVPMFASIFYHSLHIVQLKILYNMTGDNIFNIYAEKWNRYMEKKLNRYYSQIIKSIFKILYF